MNAAVPPEALASAPPKPQKPEITTFQQLKAWVSTRVLSDGGSSITKWEYQLKAGEGDFGSWKSVVASDRQIVFAIGGLSKGTTYQVKTRATNAVGTGPESDASDPKTLPATKPDTPGKPSVSGSDASVTLNWTPGDDGGAALTQWEYRMKEGSGNYGGWTRICRTTDDETCPDRTSHTVSDLTNGTAYTFQVRSTNGVGASDDSPASDAVTPSTTPAAPGTFTVSGGDRQVTLTWTAGGNGGSAITGWKYLKNESNTWDSDWTTIQNSGASTTTHTVSGLTNGTEYTFKVRAVNANGDGAESPESDAVTPSTTPAAPNKPTVAARHQAVVLGWTSTGTGGAAITGWKYLKKEGNTWDTDWTEVPNSGANTTSYTVTGLTNATTYRFKVRAVNANGDGTPSAESDPATPGSTSVSAENIAGTTATLKLSGYTGTWSYRGRQNGATCQRDLTGTSSDLSGLDMGTQYTYDVYASGDCSGAILATLAFTTTTTPAAPSRPTVSRGDQQVTLTWTPGVNGGSAITGWEMRKEEAGTWEATWTAIPNSGAGKTSHTVTGLTNGTEYRFQVRAVNANGDGAASPASDPVTPATASQNQTGSPSVEEEAEEEPAEAPPSPSRPSVAADGGQVTLTWSSRGDGGSRIRGWQYSYRTDGDYGPWTNMPDSRANTTSFTVTGLTKGATYRFRVRAVNAVGAGAASPDSVAVRIATIPAAPGTPTVSAGHGQVTLTWAPGDDGGSPITKWQYASRVADAYGEWTDIPESAANTTSFTVTGLTNGATYRFKVRGVNAEGAGPASPESTAVTLATTPAAPGKPTGSGGYESVTLTWTAGGDGGSPITGWQYRRESGGGWTEVPGSGRHTTSHTVTGLTNGVAYRFQVRAVNALGPGEPSPRSDPVSPVDSEPTFGDARVPDQSYEQGVPIAPLTLPAATGGDGRLTYALAPALPAGLAFDVATRTLTGTPARPEEAATWTWTATDSDPSDPDRASLSFAIEVAVATADRAIMEDSLAAHGRALLTNATGAIGERFRRGNTGAKRAEDALRAAAGSLGGQLRGAILSAARAADGGGEPGAARASFPAPGRSAGVSPLSGGEAAALSRGSFGGDEVLRGRSFAAQLGGGEVRPSRWTVWGAGAAQRFDGASVAGSFDGQVNSVFGGLDVRLAGNWLAGAAASRSWGASDYDATGMAGSRGRLTTALNGIYPYLRRESPGGLEVWAIGGYGRGEAEDLRDGGAGAEASGLEMRMGAAGLRRKVTDLGGLELSVVGGAGYLLLTTEDGRRAVDGVSAEVSQGRLGLEMSRRVGTLAPYVRVGGRFDGGDVATGAGLEVLAGLQYAGARVDVEAQGRWLATHAAAGYEEYGGMARIAVRGRSDGGGLRLNLAPRWGAAGMADGMLGGGEHLLGGAAPAAAMLPVGGAAGWNPLDRSLLLRGDMGYGFALRRGVLIPALAYERDGYRGPRTRFGFAYEARSAPGRDGLAPIAGPRWGLVAGWEPATAAAASDYRMEVRYSRPF